ncbi:unnamed protein product, partial [Mesorhabditis spiculigera]
MGLAGAARPILETPLTLEILEADLRAALETDATFGPAITIKQVGKGAGFISKMAKVDFDWQGNPEETQRLPKVAVVKIVGETAKANLSDTELQFFSADREAFGIAPDLRIPKFYCGRKFGKDGIEMGYLAEEFSTGQMRHIYEQVEETGVLDVLDEMAKLAAYSRNHPETLDKWTNAGIETLLRGGRTLESINLRLENMKNIYPELAPDCAYCVLCHGDLWTPNILWNTTDGDFRLAVILDWQLANTGSPTEDLVYFLHSALSATEYPEKIKYYLSHYYNKLAAAIKGPMPWEDFDQFVKAYEMSYVLSVSVLVPWYAQEKDELLGDNRDDAALVQAFDGKITFLAKETVRCMEKWF